ncbi:hypothetical protein [Jeotgalibaca ciconiae]|nr:hypothetical protein [Jeotgalibaca ciconiae]HJA90088.1 hypothetical protein [Candidatus Jeotgalibaca merdavium]
MKIYFHKKQKEKFTSFSQEINQVLTFIPYDEDIKKEGIIVAKTKEVYQLSQSKKMMVFVLSMSLYGLATLFSELIPSINLGVIEFSVEYLAFIPLTLAILFDPLSAAVGAATGEVIFSEIMLGQFGGIGEIEKFILFSLGIYVAGMMVKDPLNKKQVAIASITGIAIHQTLGGVVDVLKVVFAVEEFEAVAGLPESVLFVEGFAVINDILFSGILFCMLPTMYLVPRLYGKIEPLLGIKKRTPQLRPSMGEVLNGKFALIGLLLLLAAIAAELLSTIGFNGIEFEATWAESPAAIAVAAVIGIVFILFLFSHLKAKMNINREKELN